MMKIVASVLFGVLILFGFTTKNIVDGKDQTYVSSSNSDQFRKELKILLDKNDFRGFAKKIRVARKLYPNDQSLIQLGKEFIIKDYKYSVLLDTLPGGVSRYTKSPGINCQAGVLSAGAQRQFINRLNYYRRLAGISDSCILVPELNNNAQKTAYFMHINNTLTHQPNSGMKCYSNEIALTAGKSNLSLGYGFIDALNGQMAENEESNTACGHRRWILNPDNTRFGHGSTDKSMCLYVIDTDESGSNYYLTDTQYVAWPASGYFPKELVFKRWSFSLHNADFSNAQISLTLNGGQVKLSKEKVAIGYARNTLVWTVSADIQADKTYVVKITKVKVYNMEKGKDELKTFTYSVTPIKISL